MIKSHNSLFFDRKSFWEDWIKDIQKKQSEINSTIYSTQNEFLSVEMYGSKKIHKININKAIVKDQKDLEKLEDMIMVAFNDATKKIDEETEKKMGKFANIPGLF